MVSSTHSPSRAVLVRLRAAVLLSSLCAASTAAGDAAEMLARERFRTGQQAYEAGKYTDALKAFSEAYGLQPMPGLLFNIAQCHRKLGNYDRAAVFYQQYLELSRSRENFSAVRALLSEVQTAEREQKRKLADEAMRQKQVKLAGASEPARDIGLKEGKASASAPAAPPGSSSSNSIFKKWWFWTGIGVVAAGTTAYLVASQHSNDPTLGTVNAR